MLPAIVNVPTRVDVPVLAATVKLTLPFPDPDAPALTEIHVLLLTAVHVQPAMAVTVLLPVPPVGVNDWLVGDIVHVQGAVKEKVLDRRLAARPPGPIDSTSVS